MVFVYLHLSQCPLHSGPWSSDGPNLGHFRSELNRYKQIRRITDYSFDGDVEHRDGRDHFRSTVIVTLASGEIVIGSSKVFYSSKQMAEDTAAKDAVEKINARGLILGYFCG